MVETDIAVVGAGVAGLAAATTAARRGARVLVIERMGAGGQVMTVENVLNHPAHPQGIAGFELGPMLQEAAEDAGAQFLMDAVTHIEPALPGDRNAGPAGRARHVVHGENESVAARAVILAMGSSRRKLGVPGEEAFEGRGVSHCAACDGPLFRGEAVCVAGGGDSAVGEALVLAEHAREVALVFPGAAPHAQAYLLDALACMPNVRLVPHARVVEVAGAAGVEHVRIEAQPGGMAESVAVQGLFIYAGLEPNTDFLAGTVPLDAQGRIETDALFATALPGIFAAGDVRAGAAYLLAAATKEGEAAARMALRYLERGDET